MDLVHCAHNDWSDCIGVRDLLVVVGNVFLIIGWNLETFVVSFNLRELSCVIIDVDHWMACGTIDT